MGQKVRPTGFRLKINRTWDSRWFSTRNYASFLIEDIKIRQLILKVLPQAGISKIIIERPAKKAIITIFTSKPGVIISKKGAGIEKIKLMLQHITKSEINLNIHDIRKPDLEAQLIAAGMAKQIEGRSSYRRTMKRAMQTVTKAGALGVKVMVSGRLSGAEIARTEEYREGRVPLHTLRADIDYGFAEAFTTFGIIGIKVWIYRGDILNYDPSVVEKRTGANPSHTH